MPKTSQAKSPATGRATGRATGWARNRRALAGPQPPQPVQAAMCGTCIFRTDGHALDLAEGRLDAIRAYLTRAVPHQCHHAELNGQAAAPILCRGGRDYQLQAWHQMGYLAEPTDAALETFLVAIGVWTAPQAQAQPAPQAQPIPEQELTQ